MNKGWNLKSACYQIVSFSKTLFLLEDNLRKYSLNGSDRVNQRTESVFVLFLFLYSMKIKEQTRKLAAGCT